MTTTWVVVAHQSGARFMEHRPGYGRNLLCVREIQNPDGRKKNRELDTERAGDSSHQTRASAGQRRTMHHEHSAHDHVIETFASQLAKELSRDRAAGLFGDLILVAEPHFLGLLRDALDAPTAHKVVNSVTKDLGSVTAGSIAKHIADVLPL